MSLKKYPREKGAVEIHRVGWASKEKIRLRLQRNPVEAKHRLNVTTRYIYGRSATSGCFHICAILVKKNQCTYLERERICAKRLKRVTDLVYPKFKEFLLMQSDIEGGTMHSSISSSDNSRN